MGKSGSGKNSMRSIIFHNYVARDTRRLSATIDVENSRVRFLGNLDLNLWDCDGQLCHNVFDEESRDRKGYALLPRLP
ncbi:21413_t:CDS:2 [Gigaspora rosea]|nr:21413_t:CDS:2 [Gigaspora rosea]